MNHKYYNNKQLLIEQYQVMHNFIKMIQKDNYLKYQIQLKLLIDQLRGNKQKWI